MKIMQSKNAAKGGAIALVLGGLTLRLTAADARDWLQVAQEFAPILIVLAVAWVGWVWIQDLMEQRERCVEETTAIRKLFYPLLRAHTREGDPLPDEEAFVRRGEFDAEILSSTIAKRCPGHTVQRRRASDKPAPAKRRR